MHRERTKAHSAIGDEFIYNWTVSAMEKNQVLFPVNTQCFQWNTPRLYYCHQVQHLANYIDKVLQSLGCKQMNLKAKQFFFLKD